MASTDELYPLWKVYQALGNSTVCFYNANTSYACGESDEDIPTREVLEIRRNHPQECVRIGYFGDEKTRVLYAGENAGAMRETMKRLNLPSGSNVSLHIDSVTNLFCVFRGALRSSHYSSPVALEQCVEMGDEMQLGNVLKRLVEIYKQ